MNSCIKYLVESFIDDEDEIIDVDIDLSFDNKFINLGLPSGTWWSECNLGANSPEEVGLYYQWGSLEGHEVGTFKFDEYDYYKKYDENYHKLGNLKEEDDAAYVESNGLARIPTEELLKELIDNCEYDWTELNGIKGAKFTGPNGKSIFIPAAGYCSRSSARNVGSYSFILSLTLDSANPRRFYRMYCYSSGAYLSNDDRYYGFSIRPVLNKN